MLVPNPLDVDDAGGASALPLEVQGADPNYLPKFLPVNIGTQGGTPDASVWGVPTFSMPDTGFLADNISVTIAAPLPLARPYFYPVGGAPTQGSTLSAIVANGSSDQRPGTPIKTPQNPNGDVDFIPVLSFPQDVALYAQPNAGNLGRQAQAAAQILSEYQSAFPQLTLKAGVPAIEQKIAADTISVSDPFHMQLGLPNAAPGAAPGGNGGIYVWWNGTHTQEDCNGLANCTPALLDTIPESNEVYRMWPMVVLAKLQDLPVNQQGATIGNQPNPNDPNGLVAQGTDLSQPVVIIQGITLLGDPSRRPRPRGPASSGARRRFSTQTTRPSRTSRITSPSLSVLRRSASTRARPTSGACSSRPVPSPTVRSRDHSPPRTRSTTAAGRPDPSCKRRPS